MAIQATNISDVLIVSLNQLDRLKMTDLMSDYVDTIAVKRIFKSKKTTITGGPEVQFNLITDDNGSARHVELGYINEISMPNVMLTGKMPWRHTTWNWALERRLVAMNSGNAKIIDIAMTQRLAALGSAIHLFERTLWRCPTTTEFELNPVGIPYFVVKSSTDAATDTTNDGFNGTVGSGYTLVANLDPSTAADGRWCNYADAYSAVSKADLIRKMRRARFKTGFKAFVEGIPQHSEGQDRGVYCNYDSLAALEEELEAQNDNLGTDIASMDGKTTFMRTPITPVDALQTDTTDPFYLLDWNELGAQAHSGEWMREQHFPAELNQPTVSATVTDCTWNMFCRNRRKQAVLSNGTTMFEPK